jgi:low affinity Fe/Cu permease
MLIDVVVIILVLMLIGSFPVFPYSRGWGYYPTGGLGVILAIVVVLLLLHVF